MISCTRPDVTAAFLLLLVPLLPLDNDDRKRLYTSEHFRPELIVSRSLPDTESALPYLRRMICQPGLPRLQQLH